MPGKTPLKAKGVNEPLLLAPERVGPRSQGRANAGPLVCRANDFLNGTRVEDMRKSVGKIGEMLDASLLGANGTQVQPRLRRTGNGANRL